NPREQRAKNTRINQFRNKEPRDQTTRKQEAGESASKRGAGRGLCPVRRRQVENSLRERRRRRGGRQKTQAKLSADSDCGLRRGAADIRAGRGASSVGLASSVCLGKPYWNAMMRTIRASPAASLTSSSHRGSKFGQLCREQAVPFTGTRRRSPFPARCDSASLGPLPFIASTADAAVMARAIILATRTAATILTIGLNICPPARHMGAWSGNAWKTWVLQRLKSKTKY